MQARLEQKRRIDAIAEVMPLDIGGANGTTTLSIVERNGDGKDGCNLTGSTTLTVSVASSDTSVATVSPSSVTFTSCSFTAALTVTPVGLGSANVTLTHVSNTTAGSFDLAPGKFTVNVAPPANSAPSVSVRLVRQCRLGRLVGGRAGVAQLALEDRVDVDIISDQAATTYTCSASSAAGNSGPMTVNIKRDATKPTLNVDGGPADGESYFWGVPAEPTCSASDATAGLAGACAVTGWSSATGTHTVTISVRDNAGNVTSFDRTYTVKSLIKGFFSPVDMGGVYNTVKGGSTVPLKFEIFAGSEQTDTAAIASFKTQKITCSGGAVEDAIEVVSTGGTSLRYASTAGQFIQNWKTPTGAGNSIRPR